MLSLGAIGIWEDKIELFSVLLTGVLPETKEAPNTGERGPVVFFFFFLFLSDDLCFAVFSQCLLIGQICLFANSSDKPPFIEYFPHARFYTSSLLFSTIP